MHILPPPFVPKKTRQHRYSNIIYFCGGRNKTLPTQGGTPGAIVNPREKMEVSPLKITASRATLFFVI